MIILAAKITFIILAKINCDYIIITGRNWTIVTKIIAGINVEIQIICLLGAVTECGQNITTML